MAKDKYGYNKVGYNKDGTRQGLYGIIYWLGDKILPIVKSDNSLWTSTNLEEADKEAFKMEKLYKCDCRVITLEMVHE